jgi:hypothetical protein
MAGHDRGGDPTLLIDRPASWETYLTSAIGADHVRAGTPNQDAIAATKFEFPDGRGLLAFAVADGHGHARHFRSERGSAFGVKAGLSAARAWAESLPVGAPISQAAANQLVEDVVTAWRELVAADLAADPLSDAQIAALPPGDPPEIPYGATLLLGVLRPDVAVLAQIGDGEVLLIRPDGRHLMPIPSDSRLDGTQTTSLCQPDAVSAFRIAVVNLAKTPIFAVFAATDGYGNAQAQADWQEGVAADLVRMGSEYGLPWIGGQLSGWAALCASSRGSGDDSTVALSVNSMAVLAPPAKRPRRPLADQAHDNTTLPYLRSAATEETLTWHDEAPSEETRPAPAVQPGYEAAPPARTLPALAVPASAGPDYGPPGPGTRFAFTGRPALWIGGAVVALLIVVALVLLITHSHSARTPAFRPNPGPTHTSAKPTRRPTTSPEASRTATPKTSPSTGSQP